MNASAPRASVLAERVLVLRHGRDDALDVNLRAHRERAAAERAARRAARRCARSARSRTRPRGERTSACRRPVGVFEDGGRARDHRSHTVFSGAPSCQSATRRVETCHLFPTSPMPSMKDQRKGSEAPRLSKVGSVGIPIEQFPERSRASLIKFDANSASSRGQYCQSPAFEKRYLLRPPRRDREGAEGGDASAAAAAARARACRSRRPREVGARRRAQRRRHAAAVGVEVVVEAEEAYSIAIVTLPIAGTSVPSRPPPARGWRAARG